MNEMFFYHEQNHMQSLETIPVVGLMVSYLRGGLLAYFKWISLRQCSNWMVLVKLILEERNYSSVGAIF